MAHTESHQPRQERAIATKRALVDAAREIFARDGFQAARLQDIAALAGKTRGAFYDNFKDKEDVFFAIFEQDLIEDQQLLKSDLADARTREERIDVVVKYLSVLLRNNRFMLLSLEFKMYVIRHPERQERLAALHTAMCVHGEAASILDSLLETRSASKKKKREMVTLLSAAVDGLALNNLFDPKAISDGSQVAQLRAAVAATMHKS